MESIGHPCIIHGCDYTTNRRWNLFTHLQRKHQYPKNLIDSMKNIHANYRKRNRMELQRDYDFPCPRCELAYPNNKRLNEHIKRKHTEDAVNTVQVKCPVLGCEHFCLSREKLVHHAAQVHANSVCKYKVEHADFLNDDEFQSWKMDLEKATDSCFSVNSAALINGNPESKRVYLWCAKANKVRLSRPLPDAQRKRRGNYAGRTKRVQSHCTAFITASHLPNGQVDVKFCRDHIGHNQHQMVEMKPRVKKEQMLDDLSDEDEDIDVDGEHVDHEEYVEDEGEVEQEMYSDEEHDEDKKSAIRFLTATDRMRPHLNPSYVMEEEYEEDEEEAVVQPQPTMRFVPAPAHLQPQQRIRVAYPRPVRPHMRSDEIKEEQPDLTAALLRESHQRVRTMHEVRTKKGREQGRYNLPMQVPLKVVSPVRRVRRRTKNEPVVIVEMDRSELYELDPEEVGHVEEVVEEAVYEEERDHDEPGTSYEEVHYYEGPPM